MVILHFLEVFGGIQRLQATPQRADTSGSNPALWVCFGGRQSTFEPSKTCGFHLLLLFSLIADLSFLCSGLLSSPRRRKRVLILPNGLLSFSTYTSPSNSHSPLRPAFHICPRLAIRSVHLLDPILFSPDRQCRPAGSHCPTKAMLHNFDACSCVGKVDGGAVWRVSDMIGRSRLTLTDHLSS